MYSYHLGGYSPTDIFQIRQQKPENLGNMMQLPMEVDRMVDIGDDGCSGSKHEVTRGGDDMEI